MSDSNDQYQDLLEPFRLANGVQLANRFTLNPITTNASTREGFVTEEETAYAARRSKSAPLQVTTAAYIEDYGQLFKYGPSVRDDAFIPGLSQLAQAMKKDGAKAILQLVHNGRFAKIALQDYGAVYGPSSLHLHTPIEHDVIPMSKRKINHVIDQYAQATRRAIEAGFDGVEISNAQRLLPQQFFSPFSNQRSDEYGPQNLDNRSRFGVEVSQAIQKVIDDLAPQDFILGFRGTPEETRGSQVGYTVDEFNGYVDRLLEVADLHYYAIASWGKHIYLNKVRAQDHQGQLVNKVVYDHFKGRLPIIATGSINSPDKARQALKHADLVGMSSAFVTEPDFVLKLQKGRAQDIDLGLEAQDLSDLAIPKKAFQDIMELMDIGESIPQEGRDQLRDLADQDSTSYFKEFK